MKKIALFIMLLAMAWPAMAKTQKEILEIMKETSALPDLVNTDEKIFEQAALTTWLATMEMPWAKDVPEREFKHFVVPLRVNNEAIDGHRPVIYRALRDRVKGLSMEDAILEVNHWCHEYVTYQPSDGRTHTPLQSMSSLTGRCGEESTFTVAALRAVGIPARQVYTPRWAHTDDNHAWVEAWANGKWHFIGACEPEAVLDKAWFNAPATRAMMMHTFVRGDYDGPEEVAEKIPDGVSINVTSNYAPVAVTNVTVTDENGVPVENASVSFRLYNYADFYPVLTKESDSAGHASAMTGLGDMIVWAAKDGKFGYEKVSAGKEDNVRIPLRHSKGNLPREKVEFDIVPPVQGSNVVTVSEEEEARNRRRLAQEDSIRNGRMNDTFLKKYESDKIAMEFGAGEVTMWDIMREARGNWRTLYKFIGKQGSYRDRQKAIALLESLTAKDLSDITTEVLDDHMACEYGEGDTYKKYILCPRVEIEDLSAWRGPLSGSLPKIESPEKLAEWIRDEVELIDDWRPWAVSLHPAKVMELRKANRRSRDLFYVAAARTLGFPARVDAVTGNLQWLDKAGAWHNVDWKENAQAPASATKQGTLQLSVAEESNVKNPAYYRQFSICRIDDGEPRQLEFDETADYASAFSSPVALDPGDYALITGQRLANGGVLSQMRFFSIEENKNTPVELAVRHDESAVEVIGSLNSENLYTPIARNASGEPAEDKAKSLLSTTGRGYYVLGIIRGGHEPSNHTMRDISAVKEDFEKAGVPLVILLTDGSDYKTFLTDPQLPAMPSQVAYGVDTDGKIAKELIGNLKLLEGEMPVFVIADTFNRVVFVSQGYTIGLGQTLLETLRKI